LKNDHGVSRPESRKRQKKGSVMTADLYRFDVPDPKMRGLMAISSVLLANRKHHDKSAAPSD
jgi:hypothetical protein